MGIFVSIASYCDPLLARTVQRAMATASAPGALHFGVVDQSPAASPRLALPAGTDARLSQVRIEPLEARGPCWARAIAMGLYDGEDWFLQVDSHMDFAPGWDEALIAQAQALLPGRAGLVLSSYPAAFTFDGSQAVLTETPGVLVHVLKSGAAFGEGHPVLHFEAVHVPSDAPLAGFHLGAGCVFAPGRFVHSFPCDPFLYFHGEEQALALRLFTHGWDIVHMPALPLYHLYTAPGAAPRPLHWDAAMDARRTTGWWALEQRSRARLAMLVEGADLGAYGLGTVRSLADYAAFSGIDYAARALETRAFTPQPLPL